MIANMLTQIGLPALTSILKESLNQIDSPAAKTAAEALQDVGTALKSGQITAEQIAEANRHTEKIVELEIRERSANLSEINQSLRAEIVSDDLYVRRMRPTFGYLMAITWAAQMLGIAYVIIFDTSRAGEVMAAMASLSAIWTVGLSVLGIYVYKRSEDKKNMPGREIIFWNDAKK